MSLFRPVILSALAFMTWHTPTKPTPAAKQTPYTAAPTNFEPQHQWSAEVSEDMKTLTITDPKNELVCDAAVLGGNRVGHSMTGFTLTCIDRGAGAPRAFQLPGLWSPKCFACERYLGLMERVSVATSVVA